MICHFAKCSFLLIAALASPVLSVRACRWLSLKQDVISLAQFDAKFKAALPFDHYIADEKLYQRELPHELPYDRRLLLVIITHPSSGHKLELTADVVTNVNFEDSDEPRIPIALHLLDETYRKEKQSGISTCQFIFDLPNYSMTGRAFQLKLSLIDRLNPPSAEAISKVFDVTTRGQLPLAPFKSKIEILGVRRRYD